MPSARVLAAKAKNASSAELTPPTTFKKHSHRKIKKLAEIPASFKLSEVNKFKKIFFYQFIVNVLPLAQ